MKQLIRKLRKLKRFIVLSYEDAAEWTELNNVTVIHNPLPFFPDRQSDGSRKQVIAAGRYVPQKGFDMLIKAWKIVSEQHPDWTLRIYGDGFREELQKLIDGLGISRSCILEHTVSNIVDKIVKARSSPSRPDMKVSAWCSSKQWYAEFRRYHSHAPVARATSLMTATRAAGTQRKHQQASRENRIPDQP